MPSSGAKTVLLKVPEDSENPMEGEKPDTIAESDTEQNSERKAEEEGAEESEFKIQIVPRQRKQRKIAVSAIQREYLDISFNILDKLGDQKDPGERLLLSPSLCSSVCFLLVRVLALRMHQPLSLKMSGDDGIIASLSL